MDFTWVIFDGVIISLTLHGFYVINLDYIFFASNVCESWSVLFVVLVVK